MAKNKKKKTENKSKIQCYERNTDADTVNNRQVFSGYIDNQPLSVSIVSKNLFFDKIKPIIELVVIVAGLVIGIWQLNYLGRQVKAQSSQIEQQNLWNKNDVTIQYTKEYTEEMKMLTHSLKLFPDTTNFEHILKDDNQRNKIKNLVAYFQILAVGIEEKYFSEKIAKQILVPETINLYDALVRLKYFEIRKKEQGDDVAYDFQQLAKKWEQEENTR